MLKSCTQANCATAWIHNDGISQDVDSPEIQCNACCKEEPAQRLQFQLILQYQNPGLTVKQPGSVG